MQTTKERVQSSKRHERSFFPVEEDFPSLSNHNNWMAKCLTLETYGKLRDVSTASGFTIDKAIQTGVDNPGACCDESTD